MYDGKPSDLWTLPGRCLDAAWTLPGRCLDAAHLARLMASLTKTTPCLPSFEHFNRDLVPAHEQRTRDTPPRRRHQDTLSAEGWLCPIPVHGRL